MSSSRRRSSGSGGAAAQAAIKRRILLAVQKLTDRDTLEKGVDEILKLADGLAPEHHPVRKYNFGAVPSSNGPERIGTVQDMTH